MHADLAGKITGREREGWCHKFCASLKNFTPYENNLYYYYYLLMYWFLRGGYLPNYRYVVGDGQLGAAAHAGGAGEPEE